MSKRVTIAADCQFEAAAGRKFFIEGIERNNNNEKDMEIDFKTCISRRRSGV